MLEALEQAVHFAAHSAEDICRALHVSVIAFRQLCIGHVSLLWVEATATATGVTAFVVR